MERELVERECDFSKEVHKESGAEYSGCCDVFFLGMGLGVVCMHTHAHRHTHAHTHTHTNTPKSLIKK